MDNQSLRGIATSIIVKLLLDEHLSPELGESCATQRGIYAASIPHVGLSGVTDPEIWQCAFSSNKSRDNQLPVTLGDDVDRPVDDLDGGLIVNQVRRHP